MSWLRSIFSGFGVLAYGVAIWSASAEQPSPQPSVSSGRALAETYCASCHGIDGNSTDPQYPKLAGQRASYIGQQLRAFRSGERRSDIMSGPAGSLTEAQMRRLAAYFSDQSVKPDTGGDPRLAEIGSRIFRYGGPGAPPCAACHGDGRFGGGMMGGGMGGMMGGHMGMMGGAANAPRLYGQHADYLVRQLDAFASGARHSPIMGPIASTWRERDRSAVAAYLSGLR